MFNDGFGKYYEQRKLFQLPIQGNAFRIAATSAFFKLSLFKKRYIFV